MPDDEPVCIPARTRAIRSRGDGAHSPWTETASGCKEASPLHAGSAAFRLHPLQDDLSEGTAMTGNRHAVSHRRKGALARLSRPELAIAAQPRFARAGRVC
jgi:hypothetical protein